jgi:hypothetical protein
VVPRLALSLVAAVVAGCWLVRAPNETGISSITLAQPAGAAVMTVTLDDRSGWLLGARPASAAESALAAPGGADRIRLVTRPADPAALVLAWRDGACGRSALVSISEGARAIDVQVFPGSCPAGDVVRAIVLTFDRVVDPAGVSLQVYTD